MISLAPKRATSSKITARSRPDPNSASISPRILSVGDTRTDTGVVLPVQTLVGLVRNLRPSSFTPADGHDHLDGRNPHGDRVRWHEGHNSMAKDIARWTIVVLHPDELG